jgi:AcrR family transcriptional regulator
MKPPKKRAFSKKPKNRKTHGDLANSLINIAVNQIEKTKNTEFALRDLAKKLGVSHAAAYKHFRAKNDLIEAIAVNGFQKLIQCFKEGLEVQPNNVRALGEKYIQFGLDNPGYYRVMFGINFTQSQNKGLQQESSELFKILLDSFGEANPENMRQAFLSWATVHGAVTLLLDGQIENILKDYPIKINPIHFFCSENEN